MFVTDHEQGGFDGFLLAPVDRTALFVAKAIALFSFLCVVELVAVPAFALLLLGPSLGQALPGLLVVLLRGERRHRGRRHARRRARDPDPRARPHGAAARAAAARAGRARRLARDRATVAQGGAGALPGDWLGLLALYDLLFALIAYAVFDFLLED